MNFMVIYLNERVVLYGACTYFLCVCLFFVFLFVP